MKSRTKFSSVDAFFNCVLFTPLVLLFWYGTYVIIDLVIFESIPSRLTASLVTLAVGVTVEFIVTYWQDVFSAWGSTHGIGFLLFSRCYNYVLAVANICHYRAVEEFYNMWAVDGGLTTALQTAVTSIVLLWTMRAGRNITAIPFAISVDTDSEGWFAASTLYQFPATRPIFYFLDVLMTVVVVWTLGPLHWITLGYVFDATVFPYDFNSSMVASCLIGYTSVTFFSLIQGRVKDLSHKSENRLPLKILLEDIYIFLATAGVILTWKGVGMAVNTLARQFPIHQAGRDMTGIYANLVSFLLLSVCYVSGSLVGKGADMDGSLKEGSGVDFSRAYFVHFFEDHIRKTDASEIKDKTKTE